MIEIYSQTTDGITFAVARSRGEILTTTFRASREEAIATILDNLPFDEPFEVFNTLTPQAKVVLDTLKSIYDGKDIAIDLPLATAHLPCYTQKVLKATMAISPGYVSTYGAIAATVGGGPRAVGNVMVCNLFAPIVPCHRVVKSDLTLGGYGLGGLKAKFDFLCRERRGYSEPKAIRVCGGNLQVIPVEQVLTKYDC